MYHPFLFQPADVLPPGKNIQPTFLGGAAVVVTSCPARKLAHISHVGRAKGPSVQVREELRILLLGILLVLILLGPRRTRRRCFPPGAPGKVGVVREADFDEVEGGVGGKEACGCRGDLCHRQV